MPFLYVLYLFTIFSVTMAEGRGSSEGTTTSRSMINNIAKPGCETHCGSVMVPYPFGIGNNTGCSLDNSFHVTCDSTYKSPKLFLKSANVEILNISDSELRVESLGTFLCYDEYGKIVDGPAPGFNLILNSFTISVKNKLTVIGCDDYGLIMGRDEEDSSGCIGLCRKELDVPDTECSGKGCCQTSISKGLKYINITLHSIRNHTNVWSFNRCSYAFLGEEGIFKFSGVCDLSKGAEFMKRIKSTIHVVVDWVIAPNRTCSDQATECKENSECYDVDGGGYRCRCNKGYNGNPYLDQGCQDIDECKDSRQNFCYGNCTNTPGGYKCTCPQGSIGNATTPNGCTCPPGTIGNAATPNGCQHVAAKDSNTFKIIFSLGVVLGTAIMLVLASGIYKVVQKRMERQLRNKLFRRNGGLLLEQQIKNGNDTVTRMFSAEDLEKATDRYNVNRIVGRGGQGTVYKGMLTDGKIVAVKKSMLVDENQIESFINEVYLLSQISHKNVVKILGCCLEMEVPVLVYEFVSNGDLFHFIHDENYKFPTLWSTRLQIATDVAGAIAYMHCGTPVPIYHRDIKSSNILLDENFNAKLSDFGISKPVQRDQTHSSTLVKGTQGCIDPEYAQSFQYTEKSDVYSFGIVLVELLTGKKPIFLTELGESRSLATLNLLSEDHELILENIDDRVLDGPKEQLIAFSKLAKECLTITGRLRPTMKEVVMTLEGIISNGEQASTSTARVFKSSIKRCNSL